ncbi:DUF4087 domain-containing protein [Lysobacter sp. BMK333-48F3]|uniref:DUF4087 domain-containing protein n=1 Tax=Lysobacter sp. BMK333-48F3 TaxID=2867962 RepID=UPI001C8C56C5|nr:DUF4087 domain-containing protein [Lysobacter sp. BMK333-48F3]MBX9399701.1 DUF4087 domain-containing protein [Lysobacter sp. BMK333-48F3]
MPSFRIPSLSVAAVLAALALAPPHPADARKPAASKPAVQNRCGWFINPTPGNAWLYDRDAEWTIGLQGGHQAEGDWPAIAQDQWVETNRHYGYGCACMRVIADDRTKDVQRIVSARGLKLEQCRRDPALTEPLQELRGE